MIPTRDPNMVAEGLALLTSCFNAEKAPNVNGILKALLGPIQDAEDMAIATVTLRQFANAVGDPLDKWGSIVGEPRLGRSDADYRVAILIRISVNDSQGKVEDILGIATLAFGAGLFTYKDSSTFPATWELTALDAYGFPYISQDFHDAKAAGTRGVIVHSTPTSSADKFVFGSAYGGGAGRGSGSSYGGGFVSIDVDATGV